MTLFFIENCKNENKIVLIKKKLSNLKLYEIILFIQYLNNENIKSQIDNFIIEYDIIDNENIRNEIEKYLVHFLEIKNILNK